MKRPVQSGGVATLPGIIPAGNVVQPSEWIDLLEWRSDDNPLPVDLQLDARVIADSYAAFPAPRIVLHAGCDGFTDASGFVGIVRLELGQGPNARTIFCDLKSGRFALGSQERVRVSMARWQTDLPGGANIRVECGISETDGSGEYLTYTMAALSLDPAGQLGVVFPPGAAWWDYYSQGDIQASFAVGTDYGYSARLAAQSPPVYLPPSSPLPVQTATVTLENVGLAAAAVVVVVWVR